MDESRRKFLEGAVVGGITLASALPGASEVLASRTQRGRGRRGTSLRSRFVIHGGVGTIERGSMTPEVEQQYHVALRQALVAGDQILRRNGSGLDAIEAAIRIMEDSPLFNAGKGAVFTNAGTNELDASIMDGQSLKAGAVAGIKRVKNPITLARTVMEKSPHVMMVGEGAESFAKQHGLEIVDEKYFYTERRWRDLQRVKEEEEKKRQTAQPEERRAAGAQPSSRYFGTVGAVALDNAGNLAAGTSTGGMTNKRWGRVGDSPIIGAGTYADNRTCAISATGHGEYFIRLSVAHDISAMMMYARASVQEAARTVIMDKLGQFKVDGGVIAIDRNGNFTTEFNTSGMYRGYIGPNGEPVTAIFKD